MEQLSNYIYHLMIILLISISSIFCFLGFLIGKFFSRKEQKIDLSNKENYDYDNLRKGIWEMEFDRNSKFRQDSYGGIEVQFEIFEIERTKDKSRILIDNVNVIHKHKGKVFSDKDKLRYKTLYDNRWIPTREIQWIEVTLSEKRDRKLDKILKT